MNYIIMGLLLSFGWHAGRLIFEVAEDLLFARLHKADWYLAAAGKKPVKTESKPGDIMMVKNRIGFI